jgi:uncharacterized protein (TIGR02598 family)
MNRNHQISRPKGEGQRVPGASLPGFRFSASAFSLVEVTLALGVAGFCLVVLLGLLPVGMRTTATASEQTATVGILGSIISDLKATPSDTSTSPGFAISIPQQGNSTTTLYFTEHGEAVPEPTTARYAVVATLSAPASSSLVNTHIRIYWPPGATANNASGSIESMTVLDRSLNSP